jgi:hypothetical protein
MIFTYWEAEGDATPPSLESWKSRFPSFSMFSEKDVLSCLRTYYPQYIDLYRRIRISVCKSDIARLILLYENGGLYVDAHAGPSSGDRLAELIGRLTAYDLVIFNLSWKRENKQDVYLMNGGLVARRHCDILLKLLNRAFENLTLHYDKEQRSKDYVPYNIYVLTGAAEMLDCFFDRSATPIALRPEYVNRIYVHFMRENPEFEGFRLYQFYQYRKPGRH